MYSDVGLRSAIILILASSLGTHVLEPQVSFAEQARQNIPSSLDVEQDSDRLTITYQGHPLATYIFGDKEITRPFFANVHAPGGVLVTRRHPPQPGIDAADHSTMHPGIWLGFGDISGADFWRNKGRVEAQGFEQPLQAEFVGDEATISFTLRNRYTAEGKTICQELARHTIRATRDGFLFMFDSEFTGEQPFVFGDQEEMGLGIRIATPLVVKGGSGTITSSEGKKNEKEVWGKQADWCDYSGIAMKPAAAAEPASQVRAGLLIVPHPQNFRRSWMHARDYGVLVANPFGQKSFTGGAPSQVTVQPGESLRLRYGIWAYAVPMNSEVSPAALAAQYLRLSEK